MSDCFEYKGYHGSIEYSAADDVLYGKVLGIRSLLLYEGNSLESLRQGFEDTIDDYLEMCTAEGMKPNKPYHGSLNVQVSPELHMSLDAYSESHNQTLNSTVEEAIRHYIGR